MSLMRQSKHSTGKKLIASSHCAETPEFAPQCPDIALDVTGKFNNRPIPIGIHQRDWRIKPTVHAGRVLPP